MDTFILDQREVLEKSDPCRVLTPRASLGTKFSIVTQSYSSLPHIEVPFKQQETENLLALGYVPVLTSMAVPTAPYNEIKEKLVRAFVKSICKSCTVCVPVRLPLDQFKETDSLKSLREKNDATIQTYYYDGGQNPVLRPHQLHSLYTLYERYMQWRFPRKDNSSGMFDGKYDLKLREDFPGMSMSYMYVQPKKSMPTGGILYHTSGQSAYGTLMFYSPDAKAEMTGHYMMLKLIPHLRERGIKYFYLGNLAEDTPMGWKDRYTPLEMYLGEEWRPRTRTDLRMIRNMNYPEYEPIFS